MPDLLERLRSALADHYAVESEIGRGGMATVFLAEDLKHHRKVAIKVMHPELASTVGGERFLREIEIAAGLDHPHILTLLDSGESDGLLYYVMPYVEGESLRFRLEREGQLPMDEAIRIAHEVADGLGYAHRHGVVHRDIKPANIMLSEGHALIADFGVARAVGGEGQALTSTGLAVGTPAYMSPEQASGGKVDARSDLYALGCVLYEMLAGLPPLTGPTPQATAAMRLTETATPLPVVRDTVPGGLERVTQKLLTKSPADRYGVAEKLVEALDDPGLWAEAKPQRRVWKRVGSAAVALVFLAFGIYATQWFADRGSSTGPEVVPQRVAVLPFENRTGDPAWDDLGELAAEQITNRLQREEVGEVVPLSRAAVAAETTDAGGSVREMAAATGAALVITGAYSTVGGNIAIVVRLMETASGQQAGMFELSAAASDVPNPGLEELSGRLAGGLLLAFDDVDPLWAMKAFPKIEAYRLRLEGHELNLDFLHSEALERLYAAWSLDTTFALPLYEAGGVLWNLGEYEAADSVNRLVAEPFRSASEALRYYYDGTRAWFEGDLEAAYRAQRRLVALEPDIWQLRRLLAIYCYVSNRPREALETMLEAEDRLGDDPADLDWHLEHLTRSYHMLGEHQNELETVQSLRELNWRSELAITYLESRAVAALGRSEGVLAAQALMEGLADTTYWAGLYMLAAALELRYHGYREESRPAIARAVRWFEERPERVTNDPRHKTAFGVALYAAERWEEAASVLGTMDETTPLHLDALGYLGLLAARQGDRESAVEVSGELERIGREDYNLRAMTWAYRARIAAVLGDRVQAVSHLKRAFDVRFGYTPGPYLSRQYRFDFEGLADYAPYRELLRPKG
jgi:serine/threonine-protein kinase